jgi:ABC-type iron transport system FetAB ATPase subunit
MLPCTGMGIARADRIGHPVRKLSLEGIPSTAKLVMVVGPTGSGKSTILRNLKGAGNPVPPRGFPVEVEFHGGLRPTWFHGSDPDAAHFIGEMFASAQRAAVDSNQTAQEIVDASFEPLASTFQRIFPSFTIRAVRAKQPPDHGNIIQITKGAASYDVKQLSSGELQIFEVIVKLMYGPKFYPSQILFLDEPDKTVHAHLQAALLEECCTLVSKDSQLWIATQSIGMIHKAVELYRSRLGEVVFLEAALDYDKQTVLEPVTPDRSFVKRVLKVAIHDLAELVSPRRIVICEGAIQSKTGTPFDKTVAIANAEFDARVYSRIFGRTFPDTEFVASGGCNDIIRDSTKLQSALSTLLPGVKVIKVIDRDCQRSPSEVQQLLDQGLTILTMRDVENYLWADDVLAALCRKLGHDAHIQTILDHKLTLLNKKSGDQIDACDDVKAICGELMNFIKKLLSLKEAGLHKEAFAIDTLTACIAPGMDTYKALSTDIFGV